MNGRLSTIHEIRLNNVRELLRAYKLDRSEFSERVGISYNLLSQYIGKNPTKNIGDETAEKIETAFGKSRGFLDQANHQAVQHSNNSSLAQPQGRWVAVKNSTKMDEDGYYSDADVSEKIGCVASLACSSEAYAIKASGESMFPVVRSGWFLVCDPVAKVKVTEFVEVSFKDGKKIIKEYIGVIGDVLHVTSVNTNDRSIFEMEDILSITAVVEIMQPSRFVPNTN